MSTKPGRNEPCHCGSGEKYKRCHMDQDEAARVTAAATAAAAAATAQAADGPPVPKDAKRPAKQPAIKPRSDVGRNVPTTRKHSV
jgi:methionyl aminopeptidase